MNISLINYEGGQTRDRWKGNVCKSGLLLHEGVLEVNVHDRTLSVVWRVLDHFVQIKQREHGT